MQIVIDISEQIYLNAKADMLCGAGSLVKAIKNGVPLPKGHGRIGDLDALREEVSSWGMNDYEPSDFIDAIDQADAIIEADKPESENI